MSKPEQSMAAYALAETQNQTIKIQAQFASSGPTLGSVYVRAIRPIPPPAPSWWVQWVNRMLKKFPAFWKLVAKWLGAGGWLNVLGEVKPRLVTFPPGVGESAFETFELQYMWLHQRGVGIHKGGCYRSRARELCIGHEQKEGRRS